MSLVLGPVHAEDFALVSLEIAPGLDVELADGFDLGGSLVDGDVVELLSLRHQTAPQILRLRHQRVQRLLRPATTNPFLHNRPTLMQFWALFYQFL